MPDQSTHIEAASIDELLAAYRDLQSQFDRARDRVRRAEEHRHTVQRRIYDRVRAEYDRELDSIRARMSPVRDEIDRVQQTLETQLRDAVANVQAVQEELAEADFRHRIGEYDDLSYCDLRSDLDTRAQDTSARSTLIQNSLSAIASLLNPDSSDAPPAHEEAVTLSVDAPALEATGDVTVEALAEPDPPAVVEDSPPRRPVLSANTVTGIDQIDGFENPHDWISETDRPTRAVPTPPPPPAPAPAPALNPMDALDSLLTPVATSANGFPSLVFVTGAHAGQAIALLPTTLTIGREHDNNVEIKDPEVARYHARILRERDDYVVEDLESSTGTWINGKRIRRAVISQGDVIRVGQTELALDFEWTTDSR